MAAQFRQISLTLKSRHAISLPELAGRCNTCVTTLTRPFCSSGKIFAKDKNALDSKTEDQTPTDKIKKKKMVDTTGNYSKKIPSKWDKQILMYGSRYDSKEDIPVEVRLTVLNPTYDRVRMYFQNYVIAMLCVMTLTVVFCGRHDMQIHNKEQLVVSDGLWEAAEKKYAGQTIDRKPKL